MATCVRMLAWTILPLSLLARVASTAAPSSGPQTGMIGGLQADYFYFSGSLNSVSDLDGAVPALTRAEGTINYESTRSVWSGLDQTDKFGAIWSGSIRISEGGTYTFETRSDDGSVVFVDGTCVVDNDGLHSMKTKTGDIVLTKGDHALEVKFFENSGGAGMIFKYSGQDTGDEEVVVPASVLIAPVGVTPPTTTTTTPILLSGNEGGLLAEYFYFKEAVKTVSVVDGKAPNLTRAEFNIAIHNDYKALREAWPGLAQSDRFGARWTGGLRIITPGEYTLELVSDDGSLLMLDGEVVIDNDGDHSMRTRTATIDLLDGDHPLEVKFFENGGIAGIVLKYTGEDTNWEDIIIPPSALVTPEGVTPPTTTTTTPIPLSDMYGGLLAEYFYFDESLRSVDALDDAVPELSRAEGTINYESTRSAWSGLDRKDKFGAKWSGGLTIKEAGMYTLETRSDDGSVVFLDGALVIDNDGLHSMKTKTADIYLTAGNHTLVVKFFENSGGAGMIFRYSGPDTDDDEVVVPATVLITPHGVTPPTTTTTTPITLSDVVGGLQAEYFYFTESLKSVSVVDGAEARLTRVETEINYASTRSAWPDLSQADKFGAMWTGGLHITLEGDYTLSLRSDDGSVAMVDGALVVDNDGCHGMRTKTGDIWLGEGAHTLRVKFFEMGGGAGMIFKYSGPDTGGNEVVVPSSVLVLPTTATTTVSPAELSGLTAADAAYIQNLATTSATSGAFCADVASTLAEALSMSSSAASDFTAIAESGADAQAETASAANAWASAFTTLAKEWANAWNSGDECATALVDISDTSEKVSGAWAAAFTSFAQFSTDTNGVASATSSSNTWAAAFSNISHVFTTTYGATTTHGCSDVNSWADIYQHVYGHAVTATLAWASHFGFYPGYGYASKASAVNSWAAAFEKAAESVDLSSETWAQTCTTAAAIEAEVASIAVAYIVGNFSERIYSVPAAWALAFDNCASSVSCLGSASSGSNTWASLIYHTSFAHASQFWAAALVSDVARFNAASKVWAHCYGQIDMAARMKSTSWSQLFDPSNLADMSYLTASAAAASNTWAYFFQSLATQMEVASGAWTAVSVEPATSQAWAAAFTDMAMQTEFAMVAWADSFLGSTTEVSLNNAASASDSWVYSFNLMSSHGEALAIAYAGSLAALPTEQGYLDASDGWAATFLQLAHSAVTATAAWAEPFSIGGSQTLSGVGQGAILSATDSWAYVFRLISSRAARAAPHWGCAQCPGSWIGVVDYLLDAVTNANSPIVQWMVYLGMTSMPGSWQYAAVTITEDQASLAP